MKYDLFVTFECACVYFRYLFMGFERIFVVQMKAESEHFKLTYLLIGVQQQLAPISMSTNIPAMLVV